MKLKYTSDWSRDLIEEYSGVIEQTAKTYSLDTYPVVLRIITAEQMMDAYASIGMPVNYKHWSYGKQFVSTERSYRRGHMGLAYEIVINSSPCIAYLMEENTMAMQALVIAHAACGHNSFFKGNYLFKMWTDASSIVDYLVYAKNYIAECEERYGLDAVEKLLDTCHALANHGVDRYKRKDKPSKVVLKARKTEALEHAQRQVNDMWRTLPYQANKQAQAVGVKRFPEEPEENILYFIEKNAPLLEPWQREVIRIVRKIAQYFYPQRQTQVMNEGWATFWHYTLLNRMYDDGHLEDGMMIEWLKSHTNVVYQPPVGHRAYSGINPYALGFAMYNDIKRICEGGIWKNERTFEASSSELLREDHQYFPEIAGKKNWVRVLHDAMQNYKDESFIGQYLSPRIAREFSLFSLYDEEKAPNYVVTAIQDERGFQRLRGAMKEQYNLSSREPQIEVWSVEYQGDRSLTLRHTMHNGTPLGDTTQEMLKHMVRLWGFKVRLESVDEKGVVQKTYEQEAEKQK